MFRVINIYSKSSNEIGRKLSNYSPHSFYLDGIAFSCFESFLQCIKFSDPEEQAAVSGMEARAAKAKGSTRNWQSSGWLYWKGQPINRYSPEYRALLSRAYDALCENETFADALCRSRGDLLIHSIGKLRKKATVLTTFEFIGMLTKKRRKLLRERRRKCEIKKI